MNPKVLKQSLIIFILGLSSGLPLSLTGGTLQAWLKSSNIDLGTIGLFALVGLPYTWKFLWSPIIDRYSVVKVGRRKFWMLISQVLLVCLLMGMSFLNPENQMILISVAAFLISFASATQDIVLDAWRREQLEPKTYAWANGLHVAGYLFSMRVLSGALALILSDFISWQQVYQIMAIIQGFGLIGALSVKEQSSQALIPATLQQAFWGPLKDFFSKQKAGIILAFIFLYKVGDNMAAHMSMPFYLEMGYSRTEVGAVIKILGWVGVALGSLLGGLAMQKLKMKTALVGFGALQMLSTAGFVVLALVSKDLILLSTVIGFENFSSGVGTAAFVTFIGLMTSKKFTATQYALLSSVMGIPRILISAPTGYLAQGVGWPLFFVVCTLVAIPGMLLVFKLPSINQDEMD